MLHVDDDGIVPSKCQIYSIYSRRSASQPYWIAIVESHRSFASCQIDVALRALRVCDGVKTSQRIHWDFYRQAMKRCRRRRRHFIRAYCRPSSLYGCDMMCTIVAFVLLSERQMSVWLGMCLGWLDYMVCVYCSKLRVYMNVIVRGCGGIKMLMRVSWSMDTHGGVPQNPFRNDKVTSIIWI